MKKRFYSLLCLVASLFATTATAFADDSYSINFMESSEGWTAVSVDGDEDTWGTDTYNPSNAGYAVTYCRNGSNDWFVSPKFHFVEGESYTITMTNIGSYRDVQNAASDAQNIKVMFGDQDYSPATQLCTATGYIYSTAGLYASVNHTFIAEVTGDYSISIVNNIGGSSVGTPSVDVYLSNFTIEGPGVYSAGGGGDVPVETEELPYTMNFASDGFGDWTTLANNENTPNWESGTNGAYYIITYSPSASDDYLISPYFALEAGKTYKVEAVMHRNTYGDGHALSVVYGMGDDVTAFATAGNLEVAGGVTTSAQFVAEEDGNYRVALHNTSSGYSGGCYIMQVSVSEVEEVVEGMTLPYSAYFSNSLDGWTVYATDDSYSSWTTTANGVTIRVDAGMTNNAYLVSPYIAFEEGKTYQMEVFYGNGYGDHQISVEYGTGEDYASYTSVGKLEIVEQGSFPVQFTVSETGNFKVALHHTSSLGPNAWGDGGGVWIPSITISEVEGGSSSTIEFPYTADWYNNPTAGLLDWVAVDANNDGSTWENYSIDFGGGYVYAFGAKCSPVSGTNGDYLISPVLPFEDGVTYNVTITMGEGFLDNLNLSVMGGKSEDGTGYTLLGKAEDGGPNAENVITFTASGEQRIALYDASGAEVQIWSVAVSVAEGEVEEPGLQVPYKKDFLTDGNMDGWTTQDNNGSGTWAIFGSGFGAMINNYSGNNDDYLISPALALEAGQAYKVTVEKSLNNLVSPDDVITVFAGIGDDVSAYKQIGVLSAEMDVTTDEITFTATEAGNYKIALYNSCNAMSMYVINSVAIDKTAAVVPAGALLDKDFTAEADLTGWTVIDSNNDGEWHFEDGIDGVSLTRVRGAAQDDWLISPALAMESGKSYVVSYSIVAQGNIDSETVETAYGTAAEAAAMVNAIGSESIAAGETMTGYYRISPATSGNYYVGFHATSPSSAGGTISILWVKVEESAGVTPVAPTGLAAQSDIQKGEVTLTWTNPAIDTENIAIDGEVMTRIMRNGETVEDVAGQPGAMMSYIDKPVPFEGDATYQIKAYVTDDKLSEAIETTISLDDFQGEAHELYTWGGTYGGTFTTDWQVVNVNGGSTWTSQAYNDSWIISYGNPSNDWLISPVVNLNASRRYVVEFELSCGEDWPAEIEIYTGRGNTVNDMTNLVQSFTCQGNGVLAYTTDQFAIDEDGEYYFGLRATSITTQTRVVKFTVYYYENTTGPEQVPYTEAFDDSSLSGWYMPAGTTFAVADGALASTGNGTDRNETIYSPLIEFKAGFTYEVTFDYAFNGAAESAFAFYMANGQSVDELIADSRTELSADGTQCRYMFTPATDGTYCAAWQLVAGADDEATASIDNLAIGVNVYAMMPYSENFDDCEAGEVPFGYEGVTIVANGDSNMAAEVSSNGGQTPWFNYDSLRDTYTMTLKYKKSDYSAWTVTAVNENGDELQATEIEGDASADWAETSFAIPAFEATEAYNFYLKFETWGEGTLQIDDIEITMDERAIMAAAPTEFRVYTNDMATWKFPTTDAEGNPLEATAQVTVNLYDGDQLIATQTGTQGTQGMVENVLTDTWTNDTKLLRIVPSMGGVDGESATWILRKHDDYSWEYDGNINNIASFDFTGDVAWTADGWTIADGEAVATTGTPTLTSPSIEMTEGQLYLVRYYIATDANAVADFTVTVGDAQQVFTGAYIGKNTFSWNIFDPADPNYRIGQYQYIDFLLPRIEVAGSYNVEISASNIGSRISVESVEVYEVREYATECAVPYENDFEDPAVESGNIEPNWTRPFNTNPWRIDEMANYGEGLTAASGTRALIAPSTSELASTSPLDYIYTPYFIIEEDKDYVVEFDYYMPSADTGLAFVWALAPTYTEGEYAIIEELQQATDWTHYELSEAFSGSGSLVFGFVSYATEVRDMITAIDNFKIYEYDPVSAATVEAKEAVYYHDGLLNVPAGVALVTVYDMQGRTVMNTTETGEVSVEGLADGIYVVKAVNAGGAVQTLKFIK